MLKKQTGMICAYRKLDIDDFIILSSLSNDASFKKISDKLMISRSAVTHRINKYKDLFEGFDVEIKRYGKKVCSPVAMELADKAKMFLEILLTMGEKNVTSCHQEEQSN
jgi:predicted DNA-binding protein YlxM (UPF0122 family)